LKRLIGASFSQPGQRARDHGLNACLQGWMYDGGEQGAVIDRQVVDPSPGLGFGIDVGIGAADKPVDRRRVPFTPEAAEVLACRRWSGVPDAVEREMAQERFRRTRTRERCVSRWDIKHYLMNNVTVCRKAGPHVSYMFRDGNVIRLHAACDDLWREERPAS
jgi:hypothetical protein